MSAKKERNIETNKLTWCFTGNFIKVKKKNWKALKEMCSARTANSKAQFITKTPRKYQKQNPHSNLWYLL